MQKFIVCGSRSFYDRQFIFSKLDELREKFGDFEVIEGEAEGADQLASKWAEERGLPIHRFPADWKRFGRSAGAIRNRDMLDEGKPTKVIAFFAGKEKTPGTANMVHQATTVGLEVLTYFHGP